jgi:hypothetical protein
MILLDLCIYAWASGYGSNPLWEKIFEIDRENPLKQKIFEIDRENLGFLRKRPPFKICIVCFHLIFSPLQILVWIAFTSINSFNKVIIASIFRDEGRNALLWCGGIMQVGSAVGALITFFLVNNLHLFKSMPPCASP